MRALLRGVVLLLLVLVLLGAATYIAGEQTEVAVLRTFDESGAPHETKLWVVDHHGAPWVRVANPGREWFRRLSENPQVELVRQGEARPVTATPHDTPEARAELDRAFRARYGVVDWWYGVLLRRRAVPVRLDPRVSP